VYTLVGVEITGLQKMPKLVSLRLETQAGTTLHICMRYTGAQHVGSHSEGNGTNRTGTYRVSAAKYTVLPCFVYVVSCLVIYNYKLGAPSG
jgi:hypothetical protein